jgi:hypothetical protein
LKAIAKVNGKVLGSALLLGFIHQFELLDIEMNEVLEWLNAREDINNYCLIRWLGPNDSPSESNRSS